MLKTIRITAAVFFITAITLLFLDYTGTLHKYLGWCAKIQFVPTILAVNLSAVVALCALTLGLGRVYCSAICPLGIFQDVISRKASWFKKNRFSYRSPKSAFVIARYLLAALFFWGVSVIPALLEPYSAYGRIVSQLFAPLYKYGNNILAHFSERAGSYSFYTVDVWLTGAGALVTAILTLVIISVFAWKSGRGYCNTICPAGAVLGLLAKFSLMKPRINKEKCVSCGVCAKNCKASCIDSANKEIDYLRCVACFNCLGHCPKSGITYAAGAGTAVSSNTKGVPK